MKDYLIDRTGGTSVRKFRLKNRKSSDDAKSRRIAAEIMRLSQGTPIIGYHDENGQLIIPAEYDDEY